MFDFDTPVDRHGTWCTQWDFVADRFGVADLLPFTISDMDFSTAPAVVKALQKRVAHGIFGYSRWQHDDLLSAITDWYQRRFAITPDPQKIIWGPSVIYMIASMIRRWSDAGDAVLIHTPAYDAFYKVITSNQRRILTAPLYKKNNDWFCDLDRLEKLLATKACKIMLLCQPHNPTGKVWQREELQTMAALCRRYDVSVISDEIHMDLMLEDQIPVSWLRVATDNGRWAMFTSASKSFNIAALGGAYGIIADESDRHHWFEQLKNQDGLSSPCILSVAAHIAAYRHGGPWLDALCAYLRSNMQRISRRLNDAFPQLNWQPPQATFLAWIDLRALNVDDEKLQRRLIEKEKVAIMPGTTYGPEGRGFLRLNAACPGCKLDSGLDRLISALHHLS